jgi:apolipoprotein N-acyltransferase
MHVDMGAMMQLRQNDEAAFRERTLAQHAAYLNRTEQASATGARIVLWPELAGLGMADDVDRLVEQGRVLADEHDIYLAMPLFKLDPAGTAPAVNQIVVTDPHGAIILEHVKYGGNILEGTQPGSRELRTVETPFGRLSAVICWDTDYPAVVRQAGQQRVDILLAPAYVWPEVAAIHAEMAPFRAIENGLTVVRQSDNGISLVSDPYGRIVAWEDHVGQEDVMMTASAPILATRTLYPLVGDVVGQASVAGFVLTILAVIARRLQLARRPRQSAGAAVG